MIRAYGPLGQREQASKPVHENRFLPLAYPATWPPPEMAPLPAHFLRRVPVLGLFVTYAMWLRRVRQHVKLVLAPIADEICQQLETRPQASNDKHCSREESIFWIISDTVCLEKGLSRPPKLHPDDPYPLLVWGPIDDVSPATISMVLERELRINLPPAVQRQAWEERWTLQKLINHCLQKHSAHSVESKT